MVRRSSLFFGIIGTLFAGYAASNVKMLQTSIYYSDKPLDFIEKTVIKKDDLLGNYKVKDDKTSNISLYDDGTYSLTINVCEKYVTLKGEYELADSKLKLKNNNNLYILYARVY